jgi:serine/threonine-protein kinase
MSFSRGARLGVYEIQAAIGQGGMGEVFRATDTRLNRDVAIKVLPAAFADDPDRVTRFRREAQVLASLNHPNIAAIHGLEETGAADGQPQHALVMELVDGATLADRLALGPLALDEVIAIARQIAEAVEYAHDRGIVHRDLKPANIKVRTDGTVKVLDFGLAKALEPSALSSRSAAQSPTITSPAMTRAGVIMGTAAYMSPEQARGKPVDRRADVWAFGCVLYEMLTGRRAFPGDSVADAITAVLAREPDWTVLPPSTPVSVRRLLRRSLEKDPARRLRDVGDARLDLLENEGANRAGVEESSGLPGRDARWIFFATGAVLSAALAFSAWWWFSDPAPVPQVRHLTLTLSPPATGLSIAFSRDGSRLAYSARDPDTGRNLIHVRPLAERQSHPLPGTENAANPVFSPDGAWLAFISIEAPEGAFAPHGQLKKVAVTGGPPIVLADAVALGVSWGPDDTIVHAAETENGVGLYRVSATGGTPERLTTPNRDSGEQRHGWPAHVPGSNAVLFSITGQPTFDDGRIAILSGPGDYRTVVEQGYRAQPLTSGHVAYVLNGNLMAAPFDNAGGRPSGAAVRLVEGVRSAALAGQAMFAFSNSGLLVYQVEAADSEERTLVWVTREGLRTTIDIEPDMYAYPRLSPDGRSLAVGSNRPPRDLWLIDLDRLARTPLTSGDRGLTATPPISDWTPDGRLTINRRVNTPETTLEVIDPRADGRSILLLSRPSLIAGPSWSPSTAVMAFFQFENATARDVWVMDAATSETRPFVQTRANERAPRFSRDGRWIAYVADPTGRDEVYVRPYPGPGAAIPVSTNGGREPVWSPNGRELFYREGGRFMAVAVEAGPVLTLGRPTMLFEGLDQPEILGVPNYDVAADGRFVMVAGRAARAAPSAGLNVVENWFEELNRVAPAR